MRLGQPSLALLLGLSSGACSLLISGEDAPLSCSQEGQLGPPACDVGFVCLQGICQSRTATGGAGAPASSLPDAGSGAAGVAGAKGDTLGGAAGGDP